MKEQDIKKYNQGKNNPKWKDGPQHNREWLVQKYWNENLSMNQIAGICHVYPSNIHTEMKKLNIPRRKHGETLHITQNHPLWKNGRILDPKHGVLIRMPSHPFVMKNGYMAEHRLIAEKILERYLLPSEIVHHVNFDKTDNRKENLLICKHEYHTILHHRIRKLGLVNYFKSLQSGGNNA